MWRNRGARAQARVSRDRSLNAELPALRLSQTGIGSDRRIREAVHADRCDSCCVPLSGRFGLHDGRAAGYDSGRVLARAAHGRNAGSASGSLLRRGSPRDAALRQSRAAALHHVSHPAADIERFQENRDVVPLARLVGARSRSGSTSERQHLRELTPLRGSPGRGHHNATKAQPGESTGRCPNGTESQRDPVAVFRFENATKQRLTEHVPIPNNRKML